MQPTGDDNISYVANMQGYIPPDSLADLLSGIVNEIVLKKPADPAANPPQREQQDQQEQL